MATQLSASLQNENLQIPRGKGTEGLKVEPLKFERKENKDRKALADLSGLNVNSSLPGSKTIKKASKTTIFSDEVKRGQHYLLHSETTKNESTKKTRKHSILTDEDIKKCHGWAREGVEKVHFTGNDIQMHETDAIEKRVEKKVAMAMSSMSKWNLVLYDCFTPVKKSSNSIREGTKYLKVEPEIHLPPANLSQNGTGLDEDECSLLREPDIMWPSAEHDEKSELKLKEEMRGGVPFR